MSPVKVTNCVVCGHKGIAVKCTPNGRYEVCVVCHHATKLSK